MNPFYEIPQEVVSEAIVNAVCHRDYTSNASVQVMLFKDRLEVWNPGSLPPSLTLEKLREPHGSVPPNPLIAEPLYLTKHIERMGTGIRDMIRRCRGAGLAEPEILIDGGFRVTTIRRKMSAEQATEQVPGHDGVHDGVHDEAHVLTDTESAILTACKVGPLSTPELLRYLGYRTRTGNFKKALGRLCDDIRLIEPTIPEKPRSKNQKYRLTVRGQEFLKKLIEEFK